MTSDIEELLREGIDRLTADARVPAALEGRARHRNRQRRIAIRAAAAAGTAVVAAAAVIVATGGTTGAARRGGGAVQAQTVAYVTSRAQQALAAVPANDIEEIRATGHGVAFNLQVIDVSPSAQDGGSAVRPGVLKDLNAERMVTWSYPRELLLQAGFSAAGRLLFSVSTVTSPIGKQVPGNYGADYPAKIRWNTIISGAPGPAPASGLSCGGPFVALLAFGVAASVRKLLSCGLYNLDGRQPVGGVDAIKLTSKPQRGSPIRETIWIDPSTYLPVRIAVTFLAARGRTALLVNEVQWLPPTKANLAALHVALLLRAPIPPGFRSLPSNYLVLPVDTVTRPAKR